MVLVIGIVDDCVLSLDHQIIFKMYLAGLFMTFLLLEVRTRLIMVIKFGH